MIERKRERLREKERAKDRKREREIGGTCIQELFSFVLRTSSVMVVWSSSTSRLMVTTSLLTAMDLSNSLRMAMTSTVSSGAD